MKQWSVEDRRKLKVLAKTMPMQPTALEFWAQARHRGFHDRTDTAILQRARAEHLCANIGYPLRCACGSEFYTIRRNGAPAHTRCLHCRGHHRSPLQKRVCACGRTFETRTETRVLCGSCLMKGKPLTCAGPGCGKTFTGRDGTTLCKKCWLRRYVFESLGPNTPCLPGRVHHFFGPGEACKFCNTPRRFPYRDKRRRFE